MTDTITFLRAQPETPDLSKVIAATHAYTRMWQQGTFKFLPLLQESLERHMKLLLNCNQNMTRNALRVVAELRPQPLRDLLDMLEDEGDDPEILSIAQETLDGMLKKLSEQVSHLVAEQRALASLPIYDVSASRNRLTNAMQAQQSNHGQMTALLESEQQQLAALEQALATLEANGIETRFDGVVPSLEQLKTLAVPGGEAVAAAQAISKAVEELKTLIGDLVEGMRYSQLQSERRIKRSHVRDLRKQVDELARTVKQGQDNLNSLGAVPELEAHRGEWATGLNRVRAALEGFYAQFKHQRLQSGEHVRQIDASLQGLLAYEYELLNQNRAQ